MSSVEAAEPGSGSGGPESLLLPAVQSCCDGAVKTQYSLAVLRAEPIHSAKILLQHTVVTGNSVNHRELMKSSRKTSEGKPEEIFSIKYDHVFPESLIFGALRDVLP